MIEKFTAEEIEIIKRELEIAQTAGSKKSICSKQFKRINEMFPIACEDTIAIRGFTVQQKTGRDIQVFSEKKNI